VSLESLAKLTAKLTPKQKKFYKIYAQTLNGAEAAMQSYDCKNRDVASEIARQNLGKLGFSEMLDAVGLTDDDLAAAVKEGRNATRAIVVNGKVQGVADYAVRHKYLETALKVKKILTDKIELTGEDGGPMQMQVIAGIGYIIPKDD
jgi:hypothetical protein